jgi:hypothetical protein
LGQRMVQFLLTSSDNGKTGCTTTGRGQNDRS